ncbi:maleylacetoacetate isomerase [Comamonas endophytica]|uniref:Maleylacetoacetate isomerase n=1 Tax=Comamonas endophytica TaxID=2949090 RepID=A0ABY6G9A5_9BURK|nr:MULTISPECIES: maleylacetoacetate isomerase [unclassified Acidovorax]MCD2511929.1 maleylacetoacetate isomerase [Acidovorax sp. D4N7]UYG51646.1 maleylacetoacetate isomerase [Acidovorax sp. 5MLIR]
MKLHSYFRSSAAYRVRIALQLKGLPFDYVPVHLLRGDQREPGYVARTGDALVPALELDEGQLLTQSMAIIEYLEETHPAIALLPGDPLGRAQVRALAQMIACDIHPLNNLRVLKYLVGPLGVSDEAKTEWYRHWAGTGLQAVERRLGLLADERRAGGLPESLYCWGNAPGLADCCLIPQVFNARRFDLTLDALPRIAAIVERCEALPAFALAHPDACPDKQ